MKTLCKIGVAIGAALALSSAPAFANLIVNGGFEASSSLTATPPGWSNVGHAEGVLTYSLFGSPAYEGLNFYDLGGAGDAFGPVGDGIRQDVVTVAGTAYLLTFGLTSENDGVGYPVVLPGETTLTVCLNSSCTAFTQGINGAFGTAKKPFATQTINFVAGPGAVTTISFIETANAGGGNNDPMIDNVIFDKAVPEPASLSLLGLGLAGLGFSRRKRAS